jgi:putative uncharacterized protein (fragment)
MKSKNKIVSVLWYQPFDPSEADVVVMNGVRKNPGSERSEAFDLLPQIRNPSESIIANHTITGHPGLYAKEETRSKGLKI